MSRAAVGPQKNFKPPCKVIVLGIEGQDPAAVEALNKRLAGTISRFYNAARQNSDNSVGDVWHQRKALPDRQGLLSYSSNQGMETLTIRLNPRFVEELVEDPKPEKPKRPWDWVVFESVVRDMGPGNDNADSRPYGLETTAARIKPEINPDIEWEKIFSSGSPTDESDTVFPVMLYAYAPDQPEPSMPAPGIALTSLLVDLRSLGTQVLEANLTADLLGGQTSTSTNSKIDVSADPVYSTEFIGSLQWRYKTSNVNAPTVIHKSADDLWPENKGPHYYNVAGAKIAPISTQNSALRTALGFFPTNNSDNTLPVGNVWLTHNFRFSPNDTPIPALLDGQAFFRGFGSSSNPVVDAMLEKRFGEPLEYYPDGTLKRYSLARPRLGTRTTQNIDSTTRLATLQIWRDTTVVEVGPATEGSQELQPVAAQRDVEFWFAAGWGTPQFGEEHFRNGEEKRRYSQWVQTNEPLKFFVTEKLDYEAPTTNTGDETPVGTLRIDRMGLTLDVLPP